MPTEGVAPQSQAPVTIPRTATRNSDRRTFTTCHRLLIEVGANAWASPVIPVADARPL
jgi:hypothetical protein